MKHYIAEYMGTLVVTTAFLMTHGDPIAMGGVYFAVYWMTQQYANIFFTPFGPLVYYAMGRLLLKDALSILSVELLGALSATLLFAPAVTFIKDI